MSATLFVAIPLVLFGIVAVLGFVGCGFPTSGITTPYEKAIQGTSNLVAYWSLDDSKTTEAFDSGPNKLNGTYTLGANVPYDSMDESAAASGKFTLGQGGIVIGDQVNNIVSTSVLFDGGFVKVGFSPLLNPQSFTLEAWVLPKWTQQDVMNAPAFRTVASSTNVPAFTGFDLFATPGNLWAAIVGDGTKYIEAPGTTPIDMVNPTYLAVTYDRNLGVLSLFVNPTDPNAPPDGQMAAPNYQPSQSATSFFIATGTSHTDATSPLFPFNGLIQDVAYYNVALDSGTLVQHFQTGNPQDGT